MKFPNIRTITSFFPITTWGANYTSQQFYNDMIATLVVVVMLIPQSLGYALVAGLPPEVGLYASILPAVIYALLGTSMTISIGPAAVPALMTLTALSAVAVQGTPAYMAAATILTLMCGIILLIMGVLRFGFLTHFISHSVISAFTTASALIIAASQIKHLLGVQAHGLTLPEIALSLWQHSNTTNLPTLILGLGSLTLLVALRQGLKPLLLTLGVAPAMADIAQRMGPMFVVIGSVVVTYMANLHTMGVKIVGDIPQGLPSLTLPALTPSMWSSLSTSAMLIALLIYVESVSIAQSFAARRQQRINPDKELLAVGASNVVSAFSGGCPVAGSFSRSAVNFQAGAQTPAAGVFTAFGIAIMAMFFTGALYYLPIAALGATIIVAVLPVADFSAIRLTWAYTRRDAIAMVATLLVSVLLGIEAGVGTGVCLSIAFFLQRTSQPNIVVLGRIGTTHNFRDIAHHPAAITDPRILFIRIDMSLYFANMSHVEEFILQQLAANPNMEHLVIVASGINMIDTSAHDTLIELIAKLKDCNVTLHLAAVKGHVMDRLKKIRFDKKLGAGSIFMSAHDAATALEHGQTPPPEETTPAARETL